MKPSEIAENFQPGIKGAYVRPDFEEWNARKNMEDRKKEIAAKLKRDKEKAEWDAKVAVHKAEQKRFEEEGKKVKYLRNATVQGWVRSYGGVYFGTSGSDYPIAMRVRFDDGTEIEAGGWIQHPGGYLKPGDRVTVRSYPDHPGGKVVHTIVKRLAF
jgi:hypothetical protein